MLFHISDVKIKCFFIETCYGQNGIPPIQSYASSSCRVLDPNKQHPVPSTSLSVGLVGDQCVNLA